MTRFQGGEELRDTPQTPKRSDNVELGRQDAAQKFNRRIPRKLCAANQKMAEFPGICLQTEEERIRKGGSKGEAERQAAPEEMLLKKCSGRIV